jgi:predicted permease
VGSVVRRGDRRVEDGLSEVGMRWFQSLRRRLRSVVGKDSGNAALNEELQFHLERQIEENISQGMSPERARAAARESFGNVTVAAEECYEARGVAWLDDLGQDVRYGLRTLVKHRSFTVVTVLTLALGIGACTAIFSLVNAVLLRSLPYGDAEKLVYLFTPNSNFKFPVEVLPSRHADVAELFGPSNADFFDLKKQSRSFAEMTIFEQANYDVGVGDRVQRTGAAKVDAEFFRTLGATPAFGRGFDERDETPGSDYVVLISHALWQEMFGGRSDVLGQTIRLNGAPYKVVGVMPEEFGYPHKSDLPFGNGEIETTQLWVPLAWTPQQKMVRDPGSGNVIARLKPGVTVREAQTEMSTIMARLDPLHDANMRGWGALVKPFRENALGPVRPLMWLLMGAVGFVLLIACGNAANLLLARAANRTHELGVRATLGARRGRLLRQMLTESLLLSAAAGVAGVGLGYCFLRLLLKLNPGAIPRMEDAGLDLRAMEFVVIATVATSVLFGVLPALSATRINVAEFLKTGGTRGVVGGRRRIRNALAIAQVSLVVVLLTGTGLLLRSYLNVLSEPIGFSGSTVTVNVRLHSQVYAEFAPKYDTEQKRRAFFHDLLERLKAQGGVQAAGTVNYLPMSQSESIGDIEVEGYPNTKNEFAESRTITPGYFSAMQIPLLQGRPFTDEDASGHPEVVIVNEAFVRKYFAGRDPIGGHVRSSPNAPWIPIVGVIGDFRNLTLEAQPAPQVYCPFWQDRNIDGAYLAVRSVLPESAVVSEIRAAVKALDSDIAVADVHSMSDRVSQASSGRRFQTMLLMAFSGMAMLLAVVGVYGLLAYSVRQRTGEIGIRMALGASKIGVVRLILREGLTLVGVGLVIGVAAALACVRLLTGFLYGIPALDPVTFATVPMLLLVATLAACLVPGLRAAAVDPVDALRHE